MVRGRSGALGRRIYIVIGLLEVSVLVSNDVVVGIGSVVLGVGGVLRMVCFSNVLCGVVIVLRGVSVLVSNKVVVRCCIVVVIDKVFGVVFLTNVVCSVVVVGLFGMLCLL